jgi:hypothetical protein
MGPQTGRETVRWPGGGRVLARSSMVELQPSKLVMRVRFPSPALWFSALVRGVFRWVLVIFRRRGSGRVPVVCPIGLAAC